MKKNRYVFFVCCLMIAFSCNMDSTDQDNSDPEASPCNIKGSMFYNYYYKRWEIHHVVSDDLDELYLDELYVVRNYKIDPPKSGEFSMEVEATGVCSQSDEIPYLLHDNLPPIPEIICYYIDVETLKYE